MGSALKQPGEAPGTRWQALAAAALLAVAAHLALLAAWAEHREAPAWSVRSAGTLEVRQIAAARAPMEPALPRPLPIAATAQALADVPAARTPPTPGPPPARVTAPSAAPRAAGAHRAPAAGPPATAALASTASAAAAATPGADEEPWGETSAAAPSPSSGLAATPTYRTQPPPAVTLLYTVRRGVAVGEARLSWRPGADGRYELELRTVTDTPEVPRRGAAAVALAPHWTSRGAFDAAGVAPERFAVSRRGRERHAANFQREAGIVTFAGPAQTWPLLAGAQDRLSWMVQLAAVLEAEPERARVGAQISMMVAGAHGDADVWTFDVSGSALVAGPGGEPVAALRLHRQARHVHDAQVEVWVAPALHHLPVRLRLTRAAGGESTEFELRALQAP